MTGKPLLCKLGFHDYEKLTHPVPTKSDSEFDFYVSVGHHALGKCRKCDTYKMVACGGSFSYYPSDMKTKKEWFEELVAEQEEKNANTS